MLRCTRQFTSRFGVYSVLASLILSTLIGQAGLCASSGAPSRPQDRVAAPSPTSRVIETQRTAQAAITADQVNQLLRLKASQIIELNVDPTPGREQSLAIVIDAKTYTLTLTPHSVRAPGYQIRAHMADGSYVAIDPGPERALRGGLAGVPGSMAGGALLPEGLHMVIRMPDEAGDERQVWIEPLVGRIPGARTDQYALYRSEDVIHHQGTCGVDDVFIQMNPRPTMDGGARGETDGGGSIVCAEVGVDADFEYFTAYGSSVANVQNRIELVFSTMNIQYLNELNIQHVISHLIVRAAEPDPYTSTDPVGLLGQLQSHWNNEQTAVQRDIVHLFTGKDMDGNVIGIAYLAVFCVPTYGYGLVQSDCCGSLACTTDLSSHELGHNWNAPHCTCSDPAYTMNPWITCSNRHAATSIADISNFRDQIECLSTCPATPFPFIDHFAATTFDGTKWANIDGATIDSVGLDEPSPPNSMRLRGSSAGGNLAQTQRIDITGIGILNLQYSYQRRGGGDQPENGDDLIVEFFDASNNWVEISRQPGAGPAMSSFAQASATLPDDALHSEFRLRFRVSSAQPNLDDWFVDDINLNGIAAPSNNSCTNPIVKGIGSHPFSTIAASTDGPDESGACFFNGSSQIDRDIWYKYLSLCDGTATISLCGADYNARIAIYASACPITGGSTLACSDDFCGTSPQVSFPVVHLGVYRVRVGGTNGDSGTGTMVISCVPSPPCPADVNGDHLVNVNDLIAVINAWGLCSRCNEDINGDSLINTNDLLAVINSWGPCP